MRRLAPIVMSTAVLGFAACSVSSSDFRDEAEDFINEDDGDFETGMGTAFDQASCEEPASTDEGTTFACTAVDEDGTTVALIARIDGENSFTVGPADAFEETPPGATTPATTTG